jgi:hypothetical protein
VNYAATLKMMTLTALQTAMTATAVPNALIFAVKSHAHRMRHAIRFTENALKDAISRPIAMMEKSVTIF